MKSKKNRLYLLVGILYATLTLATPSLSFSQNQIRVSEVLMVLCIFDKNFILPLTLGCFLANGIGLSLNYHAFTLDIVIGPIATLITGYLMHRLNKIVILKKELVSLIIPTLINGIIIGLELTFYLYPIGNFLNYFILNFCYVAFGEIIAVYILGIFMYSPLKRVAEYIADAYEGL